MTSQEMQEELKKAQTLNSLLTLKEELKDEGTFRIEILRILEGIKEAIEKLEKK